MASFTLTMRYDSGSGAWVKNLGFTAAYLDQEGKSINCLTAMKRAQMPVAPHTFGVGSKETLN